MAIKIIDFAEQVSELITPADTLVMIMPQRRDRQSPSVVCSVGVYPVSAATAIVEQSLSPVATIRANPSATNVNWSSPPTLNTVTNSTSPKIDVFDGSLSAIKVTTSGGNCTVEGKY